MKSKKTDRMSEIKTSVYWSKESECPVLQVDTSGIVEKIRIDINEGSVYLGNPEEEELELPQARARAYNEHFDLDDYRAELERKAGFHSTPMEDALLAIAVRLGAGSWNDPIGLTGEIAEIIKEVLPDPGDQANTGNYEKLATKKFLKNIAKQKWSGQ